jgi:hypothetical protein
MHLMVLEKRRLRNTVRANGGTITIGSDPKCQVHLPDPRLGSHQASISQDDDGLWWLEVLDLSTPTCLNRAVQKSRAKLRHADEVEFGSFSVRFFIESDKSRDELRRERIVALTKSHGETLPLGTIVHKESQAMAVSKEHLEQMTLLAIRLSQVESIADTLPPVLRAMIRTFDASQAWVGIRKQDHGEFDLAFGQSNKGTPCVRPSFSTTTQSRCMDHGQHVCTPAVPIDGVRSAMAVPLEGESGVLGMLYVENAPDAQPYDEESLNALKAMATCAAIPIATAMRQSAAKHRETISTEQMLARATQDAVTPKVLPVWDELQAAAYRHMGTGSCCDFYDIVQHRDKTAAIIVAKLHVDLLALPRHFAELRAAFRSAALYSEAPHLFARALNWMLFAADSNNRIDLAAAWVCPTTGKVTYCLAGRSVVLARLHGDGTCEMVSSEGEPAVGQTRSPAFESSTFELESGDSIALATDGVNLAVNDSEEVFGFAGLKESLCDGLGDAPGLVLGELASDLTDFVSAGKQPEDITVVMLRRN